MIIETKRPTGEHSRRYNSPLSCDVGVLTCNENVNNRDIVLHYRDSGLHHIQIHSPIFSHGIDGWQIDLKLANNKKLTALVYYHYHIMVREKGLRAK